MLSFILHYQDSEGIETDSMRNPPRPVKQPRLGSFTSDRLFDEDSELSEGSEHTELTLPLWMLMAVTKQLSQTPSMAISNATKNSTMASGTRC
jgi:hypothetical protein